MREDCKEADCDKPVTARGWCRMHYVRWYRQRTEGARCSASSCEAVAYSNGFCAKHYNRWKRYGDPEKLVRQPRGERFQDSRHGYVYLRRPDHPSAHRQGWVPEHRLVVEEHLGRFLLPDETVHHINGVCDDNRLENLELWASKHPGGQRVADLLSWAREIIERYG